MNIEESPEGKVAIGNCVEDLLCGRQGCHTSFFLQKGSPAFLTMVSQAFERGIKVFDDQQQKPMLQTLMDFRQYGLGGIIRQQPALLCSIIDIKFAGVRCGKAIGES